MTGSHEFLQTLTIVLCTAGVTTVAFQWLRQPVVLGYILAGLIVSPHSPVPLVADAGVVQMLSEAGVILLMFSLGLELRLRAIAQVGATAGITAVIQCSIMLWLGFVVGQAFGWTARESIFAGAIIAISSTTIIAKAFDEQRVTGRLRALVVGILIVEDLIAILLMVTLTAISSGDGLSASTLATSSARLVAFLVALVVVGLLVVPRTIRAIVRLDRPETTLVASIGLCFAVALLALELGYSVALGAFIAGSLVAESGEGKQVEHVIQPVRDMFAAIFFVSVGMLIDPALIARHWAAVTVLTGVVIVGKVVSVTAGAFLAGNGTRTSIQAGMSLAQIGEFSFIIASLGVSLHATGDFLYPIAVAVSALTTLTTPWLIRASGPVAALVDRKLPRPLQTFAALYGSWVDRLGRDPDRKTTTATTRRLAKLLALDALLLAGVVIGASVFATRMGQTIAGRLGLPAELSHALVLVGAAAAALPLCIGIFRVARRLGLTLALAALPRTKLDTAAPPRRVLVVTLQVAIVLLIGLPLLALTQPFVSGFAGALVLVALLVGLSLAFWRGATDLHGHVKAGAEMIVEALRAQSGKDVASTGAQALAQVHLLLPGLGEPSALQLDEQSAAAGKTLADIHLRGTTGATVLAIIRGDGAAIVPSARDVLRAGDVLALAGTEEAVEAAKELLQHGATTRDPCSVGRRE